MSSNIAARTPGVCFSIEMSASAFNDWRSSIWRRVISPFSTKIVQLSSSSTARSTTIASFVALSRCGPSLCLPFGYGGHSPPLRGSEATTASRCSEGMFAFALWDMRRQRLLLARDRIGKKPLYFSFDGTSLWFASEAKAILQDPSVPRDVDDSRSMPSSTTSMSPTGAAPLPRCRGCPPAHTLAFDETGSAEQQRYWKLSYADQLQQTDEESCELIRSHSARSYAPATSQRCPSRSFPRPAASIRARLSAAMAQQTCRPS